MLNCKVKCIYNGGGFIEGNIYKIINGQIEYENKEFSIMKFDSIEEVNNRFISQFELYKEESLKEKYFNQIKEFYLFKLRNGDLCIQIKKRLLIFDEGGFYDINGFKNDMSHFFGIEYDIIEVYKLNDVFTSSLFNLNDYTLEWEREPEIIELTIGQIAKKYNLDPKQIKIIE